MEASMKLQQSENGANDEQIEENRDIRAKQDNYRQVIFGQIADCLVPPHPGPPDAGDDELANAAINDPAASELDAQDEHPTIWRALFLTALVIIVLTVVFWKNLRQVGA
jgi:hypothetical protein